jgi:hypothetical protein
MLREVDKVTLPPGNLLADKTLMSGRSMPEPIRCADVKAGRGVGRRPDVQERAVGAPIRNSLQNSWRNQ